MHGGPRFKPPIWVPETHPLTMETIYRTLKLYQLFRARCKPYPVLPGQTGGTGERGCVLYFSLPGGGWGTPPMGPRGVGGLLGCP